MAVKAIMEYLDASDCNMEEGSLRFDANVSIRKPGEKGLRTKTEIKNMNSFFHLEKAIEAEVKRQAHFYTLYPDRRMEQGTYRYDADKNEVQLMRKKEEAMDYRYFPEPDLPPLRLSESYILSIRNSLPELPAQRLERYLSTHALPRPAALLLIEEKSLSDFFEAAIQHTPHAKSLCNWITVEFVGRLKEKGISLAQSGLRATEIASLVNLIHSNAITGKIAKKIADIMVASPDRDIKQIVEENPDFQPIRDEATIERLVDEVISANPAAVSDAKSNPRALGFLVGKVMEACRGKATPSTVNELLKKKLNISRE